MVSVAIKRTDRQDWIFTNPWFWACLGFGICLLNGVTVFAQRESLNGLGTVFLFIGLLATGIGVAIRLNSTAPPYLDRHAPKSRMMILMSMALLFGLIALATTVLLLLRIFDVFPIHFRLSGLVIIWFLMGPLSLVAAIYCLKRSKPNHVLGAAEEGAALLICASLAAFCAAWALYNPESPEDWDSMRLFLGVFFVVGLAAAPLLLVSQAVRRLVVSLLVVFHFGGMFTAVMSPPPSPGIFQQLWGRIYQPYLEFMYLNNAYHFYAPEPGPASYLWFRMDYEDPQGKHWAYWTKVPDVDDKGWHKNTVALEYQRMLALTENAVPADPTPSMTVTLADGTSVYAPWYERRVEHSPNPISGGNIGQLEINKSGLIVPFHPSIPMAQQFLQPNANSRAMLESYAKHVCKQPHPKHPDWKINSVKIYRVVHIIPFVGPFVKEHMDPRDPTNYLPYYLGQYDPQGKLLDNNEFDSNGQLIKAADPFLFWLLPNLRDPPTHLLKSRIRSWAAKHAGDPDWIYEFDESEKRHLLVPDKSL